LEIIVEAERAILAGGCFWGLENLLRQCSGVVSTRVGYTGGDVSHPTLYEHGSHVEAVEVTFDTARVTYRYILEFFFQIHDPTTRDRQGEHHLGCNYQSAVFYRGDRQRRIAEQTIADVDASAFWPAKIATGVYPVAEFFEAEEKFRVFIDRFPDGYTNHFVRPGWKLSHRARLTGIR
jgi:peptide-methionine (S)-S-oxide reductase